eukprot:UN01576
MDIEGQNQQQFYLTAETAPHWAMYPKGLNVEMVHFVSYIVSTLFLIILALNGDGFFPTIWPSLVITIIRAYWIQQFVTKYPTFKAMRYHPDNLYGVNHIVGHTRNSGLCWFIFNSVFVFFNCIGTAVYIALTINALHAKHAEIGGILMIFTLCSAWFSWITIVMTIKSWYAYRYAIYPDANGVVMYNNNNNNNTNGFPEHPFEQNSQQQQQFNNSTYTAPQQPAAVHDQYEKLI